MLNTMCFLFDWMIEWMDGWWMVINYELISGNSKQNKTNETHKVCERGGKKKRFFVVDDFFYQFTNQLTNDEILIIFRWIYCNWFLIGMFVCLVFYLIYLNQLFSFFHHIVVTVVIISIINDWVIIIIILLLLLFFMIKKLFFFLISK